jgi:hypothetical protein
MTPNTVKSPVSSITMTPNTVKSPISSITMTPKIIKGGLDNDDNSDDDEEEKEQENNNKKKQKNQSKIKLLEDQVLKNTKQKNFYILSSVGVYDQPISVNIKKQILSKFNQRPENIHGELIRFIILDTGFKEGIDLFDIKYIHIFEPSTVPSDQKQVIGRGTRTCGQKGLEFHPTQGWTLHVFVYDLEIQEKLHKTFLGAKTTMELYLKTMDLDFRILNFAHDLERTSIAGAVDHDLNVNVHSFSIPIVSINERNHHATINEHLPKNTNTIYGGANTHKLIIRPGSPIVVNNSQQSIQSQPEHIQEKRLNYHDMKRFIMDNFREFSWEPVTMENQCQDKQKGGSGEVIKFNPSQNFIRHYFQPLNPIKGMLLHHSTGSGKCHSKNTPILMYNGTIKMVQDVVVGDELMGDDSTPRKVLSLANGIDNMYDIIPVKGEKYTVNSEHILCLKYTGKGSISNVIKSQPNLPFKTTILNNKTFNLLAKSFKTREEAEEYLNQFTEEDRIIEIEVKDYFKLAQSLRRNLKGYRKGVEFEEKTLSFDPYIIGLWLGDGSKRGSVFSSQDAKILKYLRDNTKKYGLLLNYQSGYDYRLSKDGTTKTNLLMDELNKYNLINNKHIPYDYKCNSRENRLKLLAGILDSDGYYCPRGKSFEVSQKLNILANDIIFLARSLGYAAYLKKREKSCFYKGEKKTGIYNNISISGNNLDEIPTILSRKRPEKRLQIKDVLSTGITICPVGKGEYFGFCIDGNRRYLMGDFTVTHNTCSAIAAATTNFEKNGYTILWVTRTTLKSDIWKNMFNQVCNESIRTQIENSGLKIPDDHQKRMGLLSKAWRIRPMSYKQFSNLILRQNAFYDALVKINGREDPLRKTLLIIDEAHKLYGGDDLSSLERPDMNVLQQALNYSYEYSGKDSVKLLLMTATPITKDPMELIKLINLCKPVSEQMPSNFTNFSEKYLNDNGEFTENGRMQYLDNIAGYISYLNRDKDARQFAQPQIHSIKVPIISDIRIAERFDKKMVQKFLETDVSQLQNEIQQENKKLEGELGEVNAAKFAFLKDEICEDFVGKDKTNCTKIVNANIREMVIEAKDQLKDTREKIKDIREEIKKRQKMKKTAYSDVKENIEKYPEQFERYKNSLLYELKDKCSIKAGNETNLQKNIHKHPVIHKYDLEIKKYSDEIQELHNQLNEHIINYKKHIDHLNTVLKNSKNESEKSVIRKTIRDEHREFTIMIRNKKKEIANSEKVLKKEINELEKKKNKRFQKVKNTVKNMMTNEKQRIRDFKQEKKMLRKTLRNQKKDIQHHFLKELVNKYRSKILGEFVHNNQVQKDKHIEKGEQEQNRITRKKEKEQNKQTRKQQQEKEKQLKQQEKEKQKQLKEQEKKREQQEKEKQKQLKEQEKEKQLKEQEKQKRLKQQEKNKEKEKQKRLKQQEKEKKNQERETKKQQKEQNKKTRKNI